MLRHTFTLFEVALLLVGALLVVVLALRVFYQDAYDRAKKPESDVDTVPDKSSASFGNADWLGPETRRVLVELGIDNLRKVARLSPAEISLVESRLSFGVGRIERERWISRARTSSEKPT